MQAVLREVQGSRARPPECAKSIQDLALGDPERAWLTGFATRLQHAHELECAGGTVPTGLLLYGPPGTGKTEIARMLAKASGYAFFPVAGGDLISEPERIRKLWREAREMRPAIIFIDEADDVLQSREHSPHKATTNKILTEMDGAGGRIPDLLVVAATNSPQAIDPAALRGGRFTEKLEVLPPPPDQTGFWIESWLAKRGWSCDLTATELARRLEGQAIANVATVLQQAVNTALAQGDFTVRRLRHEHIDASMRVVLG
jgi:transitional endoplasmic reticulum ATPase